VLTAVYGGDGSNDSSTSDPLTQTVQQATTSTFISSSAEPSRAGQPVTFTASVSSIMYSGAVPSGSVSFLANGTSVGSSSLDSTGQATFTTSALTAGTYTITAVYAGDTSFAGSTSSGLSQVVQVATTTWLNTSVNPAGTGQTVTFTATVTESGGTSTPTGTVTFEDGNTVLGSSTLDSTGQATFTTNVLAVGDHEIKADYAGNQVFVASTSLALDESVQLARSWIVNTLADTPLTANGASDTAQDAQGNVSLRSAIQQADYDGLNGISQGPFIITFASGLSGTISLQSPLDSLRFNTSIEANIQAITAD
jgi:hypothetical protein